MLRNGTFIDAITSPRFQPVIFTRRRGNGETAFVADSSQQRRKRIVREYVAINASTRNRGSGCGKIADAYLSNKSSHIRVLSTVEEKPVLTVGDIN